MTLGAQVTPSVLGMELVLGYREYNARGKVQEVKGNVVVVKWEKGKKGLPKELGVEMLEVVKNGD